MALCLHLKVRTETLVVSWSSCSFPAFISELDTNHIFRVLLIPLDPFQETLVVVMRNLESVKRAKNVHFFVSVKRQNVEPPHLKAELH